ncbi:MAG TPA: 2-dehydropantoate 2-reductase [Gaiellaceae bacterium]|nr:2-dehydropantoate 2-reductase [Gaiellaceae bacterium]
MRFAVVGAGAIGAYVGAALVRGGSDVVLIARGAQLEALRERGVRVLSPRGDFEAHPEATDDLAAVAGADVVFVGLKAYSLPELAPRLAEHLSPGAAVVPGQNGVPWWFFQSFRGPLAGTTIERVDPGGAVTRAIAPERVVGCVPYPATELVEPGVVRHIEGTRFAIGEPDGSQSERCAAISAAFAAGGLRCPVEDEIREQLWLKLIGNVAFNPLTALTGATLGGIGLVPEAVALARAVMEECAAVGAALGIELPVSLDRRLEAGIAVGDHRTSMLQDLEAGKPLELDALTGAVIEIADRLEVSVPQTRALDAAIRLRERVR